MFLFIDFSIEILVRRFFCFVYFDHRQNKYAYLNILYDLNCAEKFIDNVKNVVKIENLNRCSPEIESYPMDYRDQNITSKGLYILYDPSTKIADIDA